MNEQQPTTFTKEYFGRIWEWYNGIYDNNQKYITDFDINLHLKIVSLFYGNTTESLSEEELTRLRGWYLEIVGITDGHIRQFDLDIFAVIMDRLGKGKQP